MNADGCHTEASRNVTSQMRQEQILRALNKASLAVQQARTPDEVYDAVIEEMDLLGYHTLVLELSFDRKHLRLERMAVTAEAEALFRQSIGIPAATFQTPLDTISGYERILDRKETVFVPDMASLVRTILPEPIRPVAERVVAMLSLQRGILAPLVVVGHVKGIILVSADILTDTDLPAVTAFARQVSAALERARLFADLQEREWRSTVAYEMAQQYAQELKDMVHEEQQRRAELDRLNKALRLFADQLQHRQDETAIAQLLCEAVHDAMGWQRATVALWNYQTMTWRSVARVANTPEILEQRIPLSPTPFGDMSWMRDEFRVSHSYYVPDVPAMLDLEERNKIADRWGLGQPHDLLIVPLEAGGRVLGMLAPADREGGQRPTRQQIEHLELFAVQAAIAIQSNRLSKSVQMWADAVRHSGDAIFITDVQGRILNANPAFESLTGYHVADATGQPALTLQSSLTPRGVYEEMWSTIQDGNSWRGEVINLRKDGSAYDADLTVAPIVGLDGEIIGFVGSQRDITPMKELDRLKSQFVSNVSHELRTPLTNIKLYQRYLREGRRPNLQDRFFDILERETQRLEQIIESLLALSRLETGIRPFRSEMVDLNDLARNVVAEHQHIAQAQGISLLFEPSSRLPHVMADRKQMAVVLDNLLANALSYTPDGGSVWVATDRDQEAVYLFVRDTGYGIAPEEIGHVFERFYRGQASEAMGVAGAGLGLSIVKQILELQQGTIEVDSQVGQGTSFTITLPWVEQSPATSPVILLIADDPDEVSAMQGQLVEAGHWVVPAVSEKDALAWLAKETPDLIVLDQSSSRLQSSGLVQKMVSRGTDPSPPILVLTASEQDLALPPLSLGDDRVSVQFASKTALLFTVRRLLDESEGLQR
jgi:PAS domain S-box-containing protein